MRGFIVSVVVVVSFARSAAAQEQSFDVSPDPTLTAQFVLDTCATDTATCDQLRTECEAKTAYVHGTNFLIACAAIGIPLADEDLKQADADVIIAACTSDPLGSLCASIRPMCTRNRAEGWTASTTIHETCDAATKVGATWATQAPWEIKAGEPLDLPWTNISNLEQGCRQGEPECPGLREGCQQFIDGLGGYLVGSNLAAQCAAIGVPGEPRDLIPAELNVLRTTCVSDPKGKTCSSLVDACRAFRTDPAASGYPVLQEGCALVERANPPPELPKAAPGVTVLGLALAIGSVAEPEQLDDTSTTIAADMAVYGITGRGPFGMGMALDAALGSTTGGGFLYNFSFGLGLGLRFADEGMVTLTIGGGLSGITGGRLGFAWTVPVEAYVGIPLGRVRLMLGGRGTWVFREDPRQDGSASVTMFDEVEARAGIGWRHHTYGLWGIYGFASELADTSIVGVALATGGVVVETGDRPRPPASAAAPPQ